MAPSSRRAAVAPVIAAIAVTGLYAGCTTGSGGPPPAPGASAAPTPSARPSATELAAGTLSADLRQSSRDAALGRMQVWVANDTGETVLPTRITYRDPRLGSPVPGDRLREIPAGSERGFSLPLPPRPACGRSGGPTVVLEYAGRRHRLPVTDPTGIVERYVGELCLRRAVERVARLRWADRIRDGHLVLEVLPRGVPGRSVVVEEVNGTPVLVPPDEPSWTPGLVVRGDDPPSRVRLRVAPARCDAHAFAESAGATAFRVHVRLGGRLGSFVLRMSPRGARHAIDHALVTCGLA